MGKPMSTEKESGQIPPLTKSAPSTFELEVELRDAREHAEQLENQLSMAQLDKQQLAKKLQAEKEAPAQLRKEKKELQSEIERRDLSIQTVEQRLKTLQREYDNLKSDSESAKRERDT